ncbi:DUF2252 family protein [Streptacidiphilus sp. EB129]|uniref:DUF2252 family protein n=1 Tax=Streptacidiphilus sp. EB129 TaxID=3156262 RepID=UPI003516B4EE
MAGDLAASDQLQDGLRALVAGHGRSLSSERRHLLEQFTIVDMARKAVGVGSVGTRSEGRPAVGAGRLRRRSG